MISSTVLLVLSATLPQALAWGAFGHETVAYVATNFVQSSTKRYFQSILHDRSANYLANVASWADEYRETGAGRWSEPLHFVDARDDPPSTCGVDLSRDCGAKGCVISAIANYTNRVQSSSTLSDSDRETAAKFIVHFIGDIGQPLHCENLDVGGNDVHVIYGDERTNLHAIWDTQIPESIARGKTKAHAKKWAATLSAAIRTGPYRSLADDWVSDLDINDAETTATGWASESNSYVCTVVMPDGLDPLEGQDLSGSYTTSATPTVELQIAKQGYRLAKWLDAIAEADSEQDL